MSYDFDLIIIDWDDGVFVLVQGAKQYEYNIDSESNLLEGALMAGVPYRE